VSTGLFNQILVGSATSLVNLVIHAILLASVVRIVQGVWARSSKAPHFLQDTLVIVAVGVLLVAGHFLEVLMWALTYAAVQAAPPGTDLVYFAFGNYTTLGYGDTLPVPQWRLLAPMTALNGILLIGWSTALIFAILRRAVPSGDSY
jgi:hypothetical protein